MTLTVSHSTPSDGTFSLSGATAWDANHTVSGLVAADITDSTVIGQSLVTAATQAAGRTAIGAGTSNFDGAYSSLSGIPSTFAPSAHAASHESAGADALNIKNLGGFPGGTTTFLRSDGAFATPASSGQSLVVGAGALDQTAVSNANVNLLSKALTISAGDVLWFEVHGRTQNSSGATKTYTYGIGLGALTLDCVASTTLANGAISAFNIWGTIAVRTTGSVYWTIFVTPLPATTDNGAAATSIARQAWRTSATDLTGAQTAIAYIRSSATGTQNVWVHGYTLKQIAAI